LKSGKEFSNNGELYNGTVSFSTSDTVGVILDFSDSEGTLKIAKNGV